MKKMVFALTALMLLAAGAAMAASDLGWNDCVAGGGLPDRTVACTNAGSGILYLSFDPSVSIPTLGAVDAFIDVVPANPTISPTSWWNPAVTGNRYGASTTNGPSAACIEWWSAATHGGIIVGPNAVIRDASRLRIEIETVVATTEEQPVDPGTDYFAGTLQLKNNAGTFGNAECLAGAAIGVYDVNMQSPGQADTHDGQTAKTSNCATFRNPPSKQCPGATPTKKATWGSIKALYR